MLTEQKLEAAALVAEGRLSIPKIGERVGASRRAIQEWKTDPEFQEEVKRLLGEWRERVRTTGIADRDRRLANLNALQRRTAGFMGARAKVMVATLKAEAERLFAEAKYYDEAEYDDEWKRIAGIERAVICRHKANALVASLPMARTGMARLELKSLHTGEKEYEVSYEWYYDHQLAAELRGQMEQAAIEMGEWKSKVEHTGADGKPIDTVLTVSFVPPPPEPAPPPAPPIE